MVLGLITGGIVGAGIVNGWYEAICEERREEESYSGGSYTFYRDTSTNDPSLVLTPDKIRLIASQNPRDSLETLIHLANIPQLPDFKNSVYGVENFDRKDVYLNYRGSTPEEHRFTIDSPIHYSGELIVPGDTVEEHKIYTSDFVYESTLKSFTIPSLEMIGDEGFERFKKRNPLSSEKRSEIVWKIALRTSREYLETEESFRIPFPRHTLKGITTTHRGGEVIDYVFDKIAS